MAPNRITEILLSPWRLTHLLLLQVSIAAALAFTAFAPHLIKDYTTKRQFTKSEMNLRLGTVFLTTILSLVHYSIGLLATIQNRQPLLRLYLLVSFFMSLLQFTFMLTFASAYAMPLVWSLCGAFFAYMQLRCLVVEEQQVNLASSGLSSNFDVFVVPVNGEKPKLVV